MSAEESPWLAIYTKDGQMEAWPCESRLEAETFLKTAAVMGSCWGVAVFEKATKRIHPLDEGRSVRSLPLVEWLTERGFL